MNNKYQELEAKAKELGWVVTEYNTVGVSEEYVVMKFRPRIKLNKHHDYAVWEPGMNEWMTMTYIGYDKLRDKYIFRSPQDDEFYMYVFGSDIEDEVKTLE